MTSKICNVCGENKLLTDYHISRNSADGHNNRCKDCVLSYQREYYRRKRGG